LLIAAGVKVERLAGEHLHTGGQRRELSVTNFGGDALPEALILGPDYHLPNRPGEKEFCTRVPSLIWVHRGYASGDMMSDGVSP